MTSDKSYTTTLILSIMFGCAGIDRFYLGYTKLGVLKLITGGGLGIWWIIDLVNIISGKMVDVQGRPLAK